MPSDLLVDGRRRVAGPSARPAHEPRAGDPGAAAQRPRAVAGRGRSRCRPPGASASAARSASRRTSPTTRSTGCSATTGPVVATSSEHLSGAPQDRASAALDDDPADRLGHAVLGRRPAVRRREAARTPITLDHLDLQLVADGRHSVPTKLEVTSDTGERRESSTSRRCADRPTPDAVAAAPVTFPADHGLRLHGHGARGAAGHDARVVLRVRPHDAGRDRRARDARRAAGAGRRTQLPDECRDDLITIDGRPVPVRVVGTHRRRAGAAAAVARELHRRRRAEVALDAGTPRAAHAPGRSRRLRREPARARVAGRAARRGRASTRDGALVGTGRAAPTRRRRRSVDGDVVRAGRRRRSGSPGATKPFWLVLGQSNNAGWRATVDGKELGESTLADGYAQRLARPAGRRRRRDRGDHRVGAAADGEPRHRAVDRRRRSLCLGILIGAAIRRRRRRRGARRRRRDRARRRARCSRRRWSRRARPGVARDRRSTTLIALVVGGVFVTPWVGVLFAARGAARAAAAALARACSACCPRSLLAGVRRVHRGEAVAHATLPADVRVADVLLAGAHARLAGGRCSSPATRSSRSCGPAATGRSEDQ